MSCNFCALCNRVRVSCTGRLYTCMGDEGSVDLRAPLRQSDAAAMDAIRAALRAKPAGHAFAATRMDAPALPRHMSALGG
jgi:cyclic pyranopterin phosphate synthase